MPISSEKTKLGAATVITFWFGLPWSLLCADWWPDNKHWVQRRFLGGFLLENYNKELLRSGFIWPCQRGHFLVLPIWVCATKQGMVHRVLSLKQVIQFQTATWKVRHWRPYPLPLPSGYLKQTLLKQATKSTLFLGFSSTRPGGDRERERG